MKITTLRNERWNCMEKGMKVFEEVFLGVFVIGMIFLVYGWMHSGHLSLPALVQFLFVSSWIGIFGLIGAVAVPLLYVIFGKKFCGH